MSKQTELAQVADTITVDSGKVGIGTSSPDADLTVTGDAHLKATSGYSSLYFNGVTTASARYASIKKNFDSPFDLSINASNSSSGAPLIFNSSSAIEAMRIDSSGVLKINGGSAWNELNQGTGKGSIHLDPNSAASDTGGAITFGASDSGSGETAMAGIYTRSDSAYGTKMYLATTDSYANGPKTAVKIDSAGRVTKPRQPYFNVTKIGSSYTLGNNATFVFNRVTSNIGSHYNSSTGRFTAPVAGKYLFIFQTILIGAYTSAAIKYYKNNSRIYGGDIHFSPNPSPSNEWTNVTNNQIVTMNANDYIEVRNLGPTVTYHGDHWAHFTGMLLG